MKRTLNSVALLSAIALLSVGCATNKPSASAGALGPCGACGAGGVLPAGTNAAVDATTADALRAALADERLVQLYYNNVMAKHGQVRPFSNIVSAEKRHEQLVTSLMERHGVAIPADVVTNVPDVPSTLAECNRVAARLERENVAMYDKFLKDVKEPDIHAAFANLRAASLNNHLPAFERWSTNTAPQASAGMMSPGYGRGYGRGQGPGPGAGRGAGPYANCRETCQFDCPADCRADCPAVCRADCPKDFPATCPAPCQRPN